MENTRLFGASDFPFWHLGYWWQYDMTMKVKVTEDI
jgi:hypothetical protein